MTSADLEIHTIEFKTKFAIDLYVYHVHLAMFQIFDLKMTFLDLKMIFLTPKMTSSDLDMHIIRIRIKFWID